MENAPSNQPDAGAKAVEDRLCALWDDARDRERRSIPKGSVYVRPTGDLMPRINVDLSKLRASVDEITQHVDRYLIDDSEIEAYALRNEAESRSLPRRVRDRVGSIALLLAGSASSILSIPRHRS